MNKRLFKIIMISVVVLVLFPILSLYAQAPFSFTVDPGETTVKAGETVPYSGKVEASPGFDGSIAFTIRFQVKTIFKTWDETYDIGTLDPPYPKEFSYGLVIPEQVPSVEATATIIGVSGEHTVQEIVKLNIEGASEIPGFPIESIIIGLTVGFLIIWMMLRKN